MKKITREMLKIYKPISDLDWMNYKIVNKSDLTFHHIQKRENNGKATVDNGALLIRTSHEYLHLIECKDIKTYAALNKIFKFINNQKYEPTTEQREIIEYFLNQFELAHKEDTNSKGKPLIKPKYLIRSL